MRKETLTCRTHCIYWNSIDKDCELYEWAEIYNINPHNLRTRLKNGWEIGKALTTPYKKYNKGV